MQPLLIATTNNISLMLLLFIGNTSIVNGEINNHYKLTLVLTGGLSK